MNIDRHRVGVQHSSKESSLNPTTSPPRVIRKSHYNEKSNVKTSMNSRSPPIPNKALSSPISQPKQSRTLGGTSASGNSVAPPTPTSLRIAGMKSPPNDDPKQWFRSITNSEKRGDVKGSPKRPPIVGPRPSPQAGILGRPPPVVLYMTSSQYQAATMRPIFVNYCPPTYVSTQPLVNIGHYTRPRASPNPHAGSKGKSSKMEGGTNYKKETKETTQRSVGQSSGPREVRTTTSSELKRSTTTTSRSTKDSVNINASIQKVEGEKNDKKETKETTQRSVGQSSGPREVPISTRTSSEPKRRTTCPRITKDSTNVNISIKKVEGDKNDKKQFKETTQRFVGQSPGPRQVPISTTTSSEPKISTSSSRSINDSANIKASNQKVEGGKNDMKETKETTQRSVGRSSGPREVPISTTSSVPKSINASIKKKDVFAGKEKSKTEDERMNDNCSNENDNYYPFPAHLINMDDYN